MKQFILQPSSTTGSWVCTDTLNEIVCIFEDHQFNETQQFTLLNEIQNPDPVQLATLCREMADWLLQYHYNKIF